MLHDLTAITEAWGLVGRMFVWLGSHNILADVSFLDLLIFGVLFDLACWLIGRLLPGFLGAEKSDIYDTGDNPYNIRSMSGGSYSYGDTYDAESHWSRF